MLAIRLQRHGRKGYATYRFVVQDSRRSPFSGRVVAQIGHYNPHSKETKLDKEKMKFYLDNGAHPSETVTKLLQKEKMKLPGWVEKPSKKKSSIKNPEKLRKNRPAEEEQPKEAGPEATETNQPTEAKNTEEQAKEEAKTESETRNDNKDEAESSEVDKNKKEDKAKAE